MYSAAFQSFLVFLLTTMAPRAQGCKDNVRRKTFFHSEVTFRSSIHCTDAYEQVLPHLPGLLAIRQRLDFVRYGSQKHSVPASHAVAIDLCLAYNCSSTLSPLLFTISQTHAPQTDCQSITQLLIGTVSDVGRRLVDRQYKDFSDITMFQ